MVIFADRGRAEPSLGQTLAMQLSRRHPTLWVDTSMSTGGWTRRDVAQRLLEASRAWLDRRAARPGDPALHVVSPWLFPLARTGWQRRFNTWELAKTVQRHLGRPGWDADRGRAGPRLARRRIAITTQPCVADLLAHSHRLGIERWFYLCDQEHTVRSGLEGQIAQAKELELVLDADVVLAASPWLVDRMARMGRSDALLLPPGVELPEPVEDARSSATVGSELVCFHPQAEELDLSWCLAAAAAAGEPVRVIGTMPQGAAWWQMTDRLACSTARPGARVADCAAQAAVLLLPLADVAMNLGRAQLGLLLEHLAAGWPDAMRPVVARQTSETRPLADCCDLASTAGEFAELCALRRRTGLPPEQAAARRAILPAHAWSERFARLGAALDLLDAAQSAAVDSNAMAMRSIRPRSAA